MSNKHAKIELIRDNYKDLFKEEKQQEMSPKEITRRIREVMKTD